MVERVRHVLSLVGEVPTLLNLPNAKSDYASYDDLALNRLVLVGLPYHSERVCLSAIGKTEWLRRRRMRGAVIGGLQPYRVAIQLMTTPAATCLLLVDCMRKLKIDAARPMQL